LGGDPETGLSVLFWGYNPVWKVTPDILHGVVSPELLGAAVRDDESLQAKIGGRRSGGERCYGTWVPRP